MVAGFGDVGKGSAASLRNAGCRVMVSEVDPICALQAAMEGYEVTTMDDAAPRADIFVTATGNVDVITLDHMRAMKDRAIVCNIGHFDSEIQVAALRNYKWNNVKPQVDEIEFPDGKRIILLSEGRLVNLGNATGHPSLRDVGLLHQPDAGADRAVAPSPASTSKQVYTLPKHLDEKVAALHLAKIGAKLTKLTPEQSEYLGVPAGRPVQAGDLPLLSRMGSGAAVGGQRPAPLRSGSINASNDPGSSRPKKIGAAASSGPCDMAAGPARGYDRQGCGGGAGWTISDPGSRGLSSPPCWDC